MPEAVDLRICRMKKEAAAKNQAPIYRCLHAADCIVAVNMHDLGPYAPDLKL